MYSTSSMVHRCVDAIANIRNVLGRDDEGGSLDRNRDDGLIDRLAWYHTTGDTIAENKATRAGERSI